MVMLGAAELRLMQGLAERITRTHPALLNDLGALPERWFSSAQPRPAPRQGCAVGG